ncbi:MAG TPA: hypothetical protein P5105_02595 [Victivallales bacterium]|nr:hypothetical protein [Candidatus Methanofastidiosa archaeon]HRR06149.1 hypothetical protein [Victivallales bacterium]
MSFKLEPKKPEEIVDGLRELPTDDIFSKISKDPKSPFNIFLSLALKDRYEQRPVEEKHLTFDQWRNLYMLRQEKEKDTEKKRERMQMILDRLNRTTSEVKKKNKVLYQHLQNSIPEMFKQMSTKQLLDLRYDYYDAYTSEVDKDLLYAELANRPHVKNKSDRKEVFTKKEKKKMKFKNK